MMSGMRCCTTIRLGEDSLTISGVNRCTNTSKSFPSSDLPLLFGRPSGDDKQTTSSACLAVLKEFLPELAGKDWISIRDNAFRHSMEFEHIVHEGLSHCDSSVGVLKGYEMCSLAQSIYHHQDHRFSLHQGQSFNKIYRQVLPDLSRNRERLQQPRWP